MWKGVFIRCIVVDADKYTQESALYKSVACGKNIILFIDDVQQINESVWAFFICGINSKERGPPMSFISKKLRNGGRMDVRMDTNKSKGFL